MELKDKKVNEFIYDCDCEVWHRGKLIMAGSYIYLTNRKPNSVSLCYNTGASEIVINKAVKLIDRWSRQFK